MSNTKYILVSVASVDAATLRPALELVGRLAEELKESAGALTTRYGVIATGDFTGKLVLFQGYGDLNGIDRAFSVYGRSKVYHELIATPSLDVVMRNIWKLEEIGFESGSSDHPAYGVMTRFSSADLMLDRMRELLPIFEAHGATVVRYGTLVTGNPCGGRLLGVGYPSMDAIEKTYGALRESPVYLQALAEIDLDWRNIIRFEG